MIYTHLTINELIWIESYYTKGSKVAEISQKLGRSRQTIYNVIHWLKKDVRFKNTTRSIGPTKSDVELEERC